MRIIRLMPLYLPANHLTIVDLAQASAAHDVHRIESDPLPPDKSVRAPLEQAHSGVNTLVANLVVAAMDVNSDYLAPALRAQGGENLLVVNGAPNDGGLFVPPSW